MKPISFLKGFLEDAEKVVVVGIGYDMGRDDAVGIYVAEKLQGTSDRIACFKTYTVPENFTGAIIREKPTHVIFVDGAQMGREPGETFVIESSEVKDTSFSTHTMPINLMEDFIAKETGADTIILGIEPKDFGFSDTLEISSKAKRGADRICKMITDALED